MTDFIAKAVKIILNLLLGVSILCFGVGAGIGAKEALEEDPEGCAEFKPDSKYDLWGRFVQFCLDGAKGDNS